MGVSPTSAVTVIADGMVTAVGPGSGVTKARLLPAPDQVEPDIAPDSGSGTEPFPSPKAKSSTRTAVTWSTVASRPPVVGSTPAVTGRRPAGTGAPAQ